MCIGLRATVIAKPHSIGCNIHDLSANLDRNQSVTLHLGSVTDSSDYKGYYIYYVSRALRKVQQIWITNARIFFKANCNLLT